MLTTKTPKLVLVVLIAFLVWTPAAFAWSWPVEGPVLQPFSYDAAQPYAAGQHRGIDIGADSTGETVVAPAAGTISFAGTVPTNGKSLTIQTADGYSVTLTHLGSILVAKGQAVDEREAVGTVGPSGTAEEAVPYVHLGIRATSDPDGYLDPLGFLPPVVPDGGSGSSTPAQPSSSGSSSATPAPNSAPAAPTVTDTHGSTAAPTRGHVSHEKDTRAQEPRTEVRTRPSTQRPAVQASEPGAHASQPARKHQQRPAEAEGSLRRPVVETAAPVEPSALDAGHELRPTAPVVEPAASSGRTPTGLVPLLLNGAAALIALVAALAAARGSRRRSIERVQVLHLPLPVARRQPVSRAA